MQNTHTKEREMEGVAERLIDKGASALHDGEERVRRLAANAEKKIKEGQEQIKQMVTKVDKQLHENPWPIVAGIAVASLLFGFIVGKTKRSRE